MNSTRITRESRGETRCLHGIKIHAVALRVARIVRGRRRALPAGRMARMGRAAAPARRSAVMDAAVLALAMSCMDAAGARHVYREERVAVWFRARFVGDAVDHCFDRVRRDAFSPSRGMFLLVLPLAAMAVLLPIVIPGRDRRAVEWLAAVSVHLLLAILAYSLLTIAAMHALLMATMERRLHGEAAGCVEAPGICHRTSAAVVGDGRRVVSIDLGGIYFADGDAGQRHFFFGATVWPSATVRSQDGVSRSPPGWCSRAADRAHGVRLAWAHSVAVDHYGICNVDVGLRRQPLRARSVIAKGLS